MNKLIKEVLKVEKLEREFNEALDDLIFKINRNDDLKIKIASILKTEVGSIGLELTDGFSIYVIKFYTYDDGGYKHTRCAYDFCKEKQNFEKSKDSYYLLNDPDLDQFMLNFLNGENEK